METNFPTDFRECDIPGLRRTRLEAPSASDRCRLHRKLRGGVMRDA